MKLFTITKINENDNLFTAYAKGMVEGTLKSGMICLALAGVVYELGKAVKENEEIEIEEEVVENTSKERFELIRKQIAVGKAVNEQRAKEKLESEGV